MSSRSAIVLCVSLLLSGCATLPNGKGWGEQATVAPGWPRVRESAANAAKDPWTWGPLIGAAAFQIDNFDRRTSDWARDNTPIFGSQQSAEQWSDDLRTASSVADYVTIVATPSGPEAGRWLLNKLKGTLVDAVAVGVTGEITNGLKSATARERPNGADDESMPSGHVSSSAVHTRLASRNLQSIEMSDGTRTALDVGLHALTFGTAWARIESGWHFPSDTLVSMALGNFIASFFNDAFMGLSPSSSTPAPTVAVQVVDDGAVLQVRLSF